MGATLGSLPASHHSAVADALRSPWDSTGVAILLLLSVLVRCHLPCSEVPCSRSQGPLVTGLARAQGLRALGRSPALGVSALQALPETMRVWNLGFVAA